MNKKIFLAVIAALLCAVIAVAGITVGRQTQSGETAPESPKPPVTLQPPPDTRPPETEDAPPLETEPPPPYAGRTFILLVPNSGELFLGDSATGDAVSEAIYKRNLAVCKSTGVTMVFKYSLDVYKELEAESLAGKSVPDLIMPNLREDGSRFLMNGGLLDVSGIYESSAGGAEAAKSLSVSKKQYFLIGEATPSLILSLNMLRVKRDSAIAPIIGELADREALDAENLFAALAENEKKLCLDREGLHAFATDGIFSLSAEGEAFVDSESYADAVSSIAKYSGSIALNVDENAELSIGTYIGEGYLYFPIPPLSESDRGLLADASGVYPFAIPSDCPDYDMSACIFDAIAKSSTGLSELVCSEYGLPKDAAESASLCLYGIFGWGDFSSHAYNALSTNKINSLKKTLEAPKKASLQALAILFERN